MRFSAFACGPPRHMLVGLTTAIGVLAVTFGTVMPAYSGDSYSDGYERPYRYSESYYRPGPRLICRPCGCGWRCGTPHYRPSYGYHQPYYGYHQPYYGYHEPYRDSVTERRFYEREFVERRYPGPSRVYYRPYNYAGDAEYGSAPTSYYDDQ